MVKLLISANAIALILTVATTSLSQADDLDGGVIDETTLESAPGEAQDAPVAEEVPVAIAAYNAPYGVWDRLAQCESGGDWASRSNPIYKGGLQFDMQTWTAYGGQRYAWRADYASRTEQIVVAERLRAVRGYQPWPVCSVRLGLR